MKKNLKLVLANPLFAGSFFLFSGGMLANVFNFLFTLLMSRNLPLPEYGILTRCISLITLLAIPAGAVIPTVIGFSSKHFVEYNYGILHAFYFKLFRPLVFAGILIFIIFFIFANQVSAYLSIHSNLLLALILLSVLFSYIITLNNSFAQAKLSFKYLSFSNSLSSFLKVFSAFLLVMIGWRLSGALIGFLISTIFTLALSFFYLRKIIFFRSSALPQVSYRELIKIGIPSALTVFALNALISNDLLIMKMWFNDYQIGQYAGLSLVGRVIFYISAPITTVMFPVLMNKYTKGESYKYILYASCGLVGLASVFITTFYFVFPDFSIMFFLKRAEYLGVSSYIGVFGIFISLYSLVSLMSYYFLSIKKFVFSWVLFAGVLLQAILIFFFHNNFGQIVNSSIVTTAILLLVSIYLLKTQK